MGPYQCLLHPFKNGLVLTFEYSISTGLLFQALALEVPLALAPSAVILRPTVQLFLFLSLFFLLCLIPDKPPVLPSQLPCSEP
jgi:hypothetical protein